MRRGIIRKCGWALISLTIRGFHGRLRMRAEHVRTSVAPKLPSGGRILARTYLVIEICDFFGANSIVVGYRSNYILPCQGFTWSSRASLSDRITKLILPEHTGIGHLADNEGRRAS